MKRTLLAAGIAAAFFCAAAAADWEPGYGPGYGMGPGMMGGYGPGNGAGMMGGYGPGSGMGPGMMGGYGLRAYGSLDLTDEQRTKIGEIQKELRKSHWGLMSSMQELMSQDYDGGKLSDADARKNYDAMAALRKQMFESSLDARKRIDEVLTKEQREKLQKESRRGWR